MALSVLAKKGWERRKDIGDTHMSVQKLFQSFFIENKIIEQKLGDSYEETMNISLKLLQYLSKGRSDRNDFQYETSKEAERRVAKKHLENAREFFETLSIILSRVDY